MFINLMCRALVTHMRTIQEFSAIIMRRVGTLKLTTLGLGELKLSIIVDSTVKSTQFLNGIYKVHKILVLNSAWKDSYKKCMQYAYYYSDFIIPLFSEWYCKYKRKEINYSWNISEYNAINIKVKIGNLSLGWPLLDLKLKRFAKGIWQF